MAIFVTQVGLETWVNNVSNIRVTQVGLESWVNNPGTLRVTQVGLETWHSAETHPLNTAGNADGTSKVYAITSQAILIPGVADGIGTAEDLRIPPQSALIVDMGI